MLLPASGLHVNRERRQAIASRRVLAASGCCTLLFVVGVAGCLRALATGGDAEKPVAGVSVADWPPAAGSLAAAAGGCDLHRASAIDGGDELLPRRRNRRPATAAPFIADCRVLWHALGDAAYVAQGWTKAVYSAKYRGNGVAVKVVNFDSYDMRKCLSTESDETKCYVKVYRKLLKEIRVLRCLSHENIVKLVAYCAPDEPDASEPSSLTAIVTELGEPVDLLKMLQMSWESRLRMAAGIASLTDYLARHELVLNDYKKEQFVLVDGAVKLADLDDVGRFEPQCSVDEDCVNHVATLNFTLRSPCIRGKCQNYNNRLNVLNAGRHFMDVLLPYGAPAPLHDRVHSIVERYRTAGDSAAALLSDVLQLVQSYSSTRMSQPASATQAGPVRPSLQGYVAHPGRALVPNAGSGGAAGDEGDYSCRLALPSPTCELTVLDDEEAAQLCDADDQCQAFVVTENYSWTGRRIAYLKRSMTDASVQRAVAAHGVTLYTARRPKG